MESSRGCDAMRLFVVFIVMFWYRDVYGLQWDFG
jgi:hypothetical protein